MRVKQRVTFRLFPEDVRKLRLASERAGWSQTIYLQTALRERFKKDKIE